MSNERVLITVSVPAQELWSNVFGSSFETWEWWKGVEYLDGADWNKVGVARLTIEDPNTDGGVITIDVDLPSLVTAWDLAVRANARLGSSAPLNHEDLDASDGDVVLQFAVLGGVVYG